MDSYLCLAGLTCSVPTFFVGSGPLSDFPSEKLMGEDFSNKARFHDDSGSRHDLCNIGRFLPHQSGESLFSSGCKPR